MLKEALSTFSLQELLFYLYLDRPPNVDAGNCVGVLELGNRLCLPRLITLTEQIVIARLTGVIEDGGDVTDEALNILQPCQVRLLGLDRAVCRFRLKA